VTDTALGAATLQITPLVPDEHVDPQLLMVCTKQAYEPADKLPTVEGEDEVETPVPTALASLQEPPLAVQKDL